MTEKTLQHIESAIERICALIHSTANERGAVENNEKRARTVMLLTEAVLMDRQAVATPPQVWLNTDGFTRGLKG